MAVPAGVARVDAGTFRLMKRDPKKPLRYDGTIRMVVENQDGKVAVSIVRSGSPAERAGIKLGDTVLSIEGRDVRGLGPGAINYLMGRDPGQTITLVVQTPGGQPRAVTATAEAMGRPPATAANTRPAAPAPPGSDQRIGDEDVRRHSVSAHCHTAALEEAFAAGVVPRDAEAERAVALRDTLRAAETERDAGRSAILIGAPGVDADIGSVRTGPTGAAARAASSEFDLRQGGRNRLPCRTTAWSPG